MTSFNNTKRHNKRKFLNKEKRKSVKSLRKKVKVFDVNYSNYGLFKEKIASDNSLMFVAYVANWCHYCKELKKNWPQLLNKLKKIKKLKQDMHVVLIEEQMFKNDPEINVSGYPTIRLYLNGEVIQYGRERTPSKIATFVKGQLNKYNMIKKRQYNKKIKSKSKKLKKYNEKQEKNKQKKTRKQRRKKKQNKNNFFQDNMKSILEI